MALIVTFGRVSGLGGTTLPLEQAEGCRTESIAVGGSNEIGNLEATGGESVVTLFAEEDCWVDIRSSPDATASGAGSSRRPMLAGGALQFSVSPGARVAVTERS